MTRFTTRNLLVTTLLMGVVMAFTFGSPHLDCLALFMSNDDVVLNSNGDGIEITGAASIIAWFGSPAREILVRQLDHPNRFAAAHFALTEMGPASDRPMRVRTDESEQCCNRMPYSLNASRELKFDFGCQPPLKRWWREYLRKKDRLDKLPISSGVVVFGDLDFTELDDDN